MGICHAERPGNIAGICHPDRPDRIFSGTKICKRCETEKDVSCFPIYINRKRNNTVSLSSNCKKCRLEDEKDWKKRNPLKASQKTLRMHLRHKYGLELEIYAGMVERQKGLCAVCKKPPPEGQRLCVDHDHATGEVRALLCDPCNVALGRVDDNPETLRRLADYVEFHKGMVTS